MNMMEVNETYVHAVYEKIEVWHYFRFAARRANILPLNFNFTYTRQVMSQFGINFIHAMEYVYVDVFTTSCFSHPV